MALWGSAPAGAVPGDFVDSVTGRPAELRWRRRLAHINGADGDDCRPPDTRMEVTTIETARRRNRVSSVLSLMVSTMR